MDARHQRRQAALSHALLLTAAAGVPQIAGYLRPPWPALKMLLAVSPALSRGLQHCSVAACADCLQPCVRAHAGAAAAS